MIAKASPKGRRLIAIRLTQVPLDLRLEAAEFVVEHLNDNLMKIEVGVSARWPSDRVYLVPQDAVEAVLGSSDAGRTLT